MPIPAARAFLPAAMAALVLGGGIAAAAPPATPSTTHPSRETGVPAPAAPAAPGATGEAASSADVPMDLGLVKPVVEVRIDGRGPYRMIVDSGAGPPLILDADLAAELGLESTGTERLGDPLNPHAIEAQVHRVGTVEVGGVRLTDVTALSWDQGLYTGANRPRGIVGLSLFGERLVTFDYPRRRLLVAPGALPEPDGRAVLAAGWGDHIPSIEIEVAGRPFTAHVDTGSMGFISLPDAEKAALPLSSELREVGRARTVNSEFAVLEANVKGTARIGAITIENPPIGFMPFARANVGSKFLQSTAVTFDRSNGRVRIVADGPVAAPAHAPRFGVKVRALAGESLPVEAVDPGSDADTSGLRAGDVIVKIDGRPVADLGPGDVAAAFRSAAFTLTVRREGREIEIPVRRPAAGPA